MNSKIYLVARREYLENLRTKTFWIGILSFPIILVLAIVVPTLLEQAKDVRRFAVVDHSGWLAEAVEERAAAPDLEKVLREALKRLREGGEAFEELPEPLRETARELDSVIRAATGAKAGSGEESEAERQDREKLERRVIEGFALVLSRVERASAGTGIGRPGMDRLGSLLPEGATAELENLRGSVAEWWRSLPAEEAEHFAGGLARGRYLREEIPGSGDDVLAELNRRVADGDLFAYFVLGEDPVTGSAGSKYVSDNLTDEELRSWYEGLASDVVRERRLEQEAIDPEIARWVQEPFDFEVKKVGAGGAEREVRTQDLIRQWAPVAFVYLLWICIFSVAQMLLSNTIEEKSNRIMEVLLSSVSPLQLMSGKILGIAASGLTMVGSWVIFFFLAVTGIPLLMGADLDVDLGAIASDPFYIGSFVVYFLLGYLFFAALLVGIGSVCNSLKEAQNLMMPITILLMVPLFAMIPVGQDPNGTLAKILSYIPPFTPFVMMNRAAGPPTVGEYAVTTLLLLASIALVLWGAAKVFRVGILMTGKPPRPMEILRLLRAPVGKVPERREGSG